MSVRDGCSELVSQYITRGLYLDLQVGDYCRLMTDKLTGELELELVVISTKNKKFINNRLFLKGHVKCLDPLGFGFITPTNDHDDVFCHFSSITDGNVLCEGDMVEYQTEYSVSTRVETHPCYHRQNVLQKLIVST